MALYVGTNYHPHDWPEERWRTDAGLMQEAGFKVVRLGHLCWDSYEPQEGQYTFEWFDKVMDIFAKAGIRVFLDISMRPAPLWVHRLCPGCEIYSPGGGRQEALRRYMEDVDDPAYQFYALRFAKTLVMRYKGHPALMGFGLCNEQGDGPISFSPAAKMRFQQWLRKKYGTVENLNRRWNTQRWSRHLSSFEEVELPKNGLATGAPEQWLDMRRFYGDGVLNFLKKLGDLVSRCAPDAAQSSNHVAEADHMGFDYLKKYEEFVDYPGFGFYPGLEPEDKNNLMCVLMYMLHRIGETDKPMWCLEFQTGAFGYYAAKEGVIHMYALLCLAYRTQMVLAWTWRSMLGGEEQFCFGLLDHDGTCGRKYSEFARIAADYRKLEEHRLPYLPKPEVAIVYCYENIPVYEYQTCYFKRGYKKQITDAFRVFYDRNIDCNLVDLRTMKKQYRLLVVCGHAIMTPEMAKKMKEFVREGGIVIMTGYSAKVDGNNTVFDVSFPGLLSELFGIRTAEFERSGVRGEESHGRETGKHFIITSGNGRILEYDATYWERLELKGAKAYSVYLEGAEGCAVSVHSYGKGKAYYTAAETNAALLGYLYDEIAKAEGFTTGIQGPEGVVIRRISEKETLYVNTEDRQQEIPVTGRYYGVLTEMPIEGRLILKPYDGELLVSE